MRRKPTYPIGIERESAVSGGWLGKVLLLGFASLILSALPSHAAAEHLAIVVNADTPVDGLSIPELRKLFLGDRQFWNPNLRVVLLVRAPVAREREVVLRQIYQMTEAQFRQYWIAKIFRAETTSGPKIVYSNEMTTELVAAIRGSISFIGATKVPPGVKVLRINGKLPGESGYPLQ